LPPRAAIEAMSETRCNELESTIIAGLPCLRIVQSRDDRELLVQYQGVSAGDLRANLIAFLREILPVAEDVGVRLAIHPDDPPAAVRFAAIRFHCCRRASDLSGVDVRGERPDILCRVVGARADNDLLPCAGIASRIHFVHLRQVMREDDGSFYEAEHLQGSSDMIG